jgi:hypothetical protein
VLNVGNGEGAQNNNHPKQWKTLENMGINIGETVENMENIPTATGAKRRKRRNDPS